MFYVYEYYKIENGEVFYVGKGTGRRSRELHNRNPYFKAVIEKHEFAVRFVREGLTNEEACVYEIARIAEMRSQGMAYCNLTEGGDGFSSGENNPSRKYPEKYLGENNGFYGRTHSDETRRKISESRKGKGARYGEDNPMFGKGRKGEDNHMYGMRGALHHNAKMYEVAHKDGSIEVLTAKQCELKFGIAFERIRHEGGTLHYKKKSKNDIYEGTTLKINL